MTVAFIASQFALADEPTLREIATKSRERAARDREAKLRAILARQKSDQLRFYLNSRGTYINGKQVTADELRTIVRESGLRAAIVTGAPGVHPSRVAEVEALIQENGIGKTELNTSDNLTLREIATASRERAARHREGKLREVLARQKSNRLKVYMNSRGTYINGKQISADELQTIVRESGLDQARITAESYVNNDRITKVKAAIREAGVEDVVIFTD